MYSMLIALIFFPFTQFVIIINCMTIRRHSDNYEEVGSPCVDEGRRVVEVPNDFWEDGEETDRDAVFSQMNYYGFELSV